MFMHTNLHRTVKQKNDTASLTNWQGLQLWFFKLTSVTCYLTSHDIFVICLKQTKVLFWICVGCITSCEQTSKYYYNIIY